MGGTVLRALLLALDLTGAALIVGGCALLAWPLALVALGAFLLAGSWRAQR